MGFLFGHLLVFWGFFPLLVFNPFKTGVALHKQPLFHTQNEIINCKANQNYFYISW